MKHNINVLALKRVWFCVRMDPRQVRVRFSVPLGKCDDNDKSVVTKCMTLDIRRSLTTLALTRDTGN